jgi:hypothetical protein
MMRAETCQGDERVPWITPQISDLQILVKGKAMLSSVSVYVLTQAQTGPARMMENGWWMEEEVSSHIVERKVATIITVCITRGLPIISGTDLCR